MKSLTTDCNSTDLSIQLLQTAYLRQLMFEVQIISLYSFLLWTGLLTSNVYVRNALLTYRLFCFIFEI